MEIDYLKYPEQNAQKMIYAYMYSLARDHRKIKSMIEIAEMSKNGPKVLFFISPVNFRLGEKYLPNQFSQRLKENIDLIKEVAKDTDVDLLDLSGVLKPEHFVGGGTVDPDDHPNGLGRKYIASQLAERISSILE